MSEQSEPDRVPGDGTRDESAFLTRRQSLKSIARFAAATAPAMIVLLPGSAANACNGNDGQGGDNGNHYGWENGKRHSRF